MAVRSVVVTAKEVAGIKCPFTGKPFVVHMNIQPGSVTYNAPDGFSLQVPVASVDELLDRASTRNGVSGSVDGDARWIDPYTGERFRLRQFDDGRVCFSGGFNPRSACSSLGEFLYRSTMRSGVPSMDPPSGMPKVFSVREKRAPRSSDLSISQSTLEAAEAAVDASGITGKTSVRVTRKVGK